MSVLPEVVMTRLPRGSLDQLRAACDRHGVSTAEYVRAALAERLSADGLSTPALALRALRLPTPPTKARKTA